MKREKVMKQEKSIIGDKMKRYTFFTYYDRDDSYRITQCVAKTIEEAEHKFADIIKLPFIKKYGNKEMHEDIDKKYLPPLKVNKYIDIWAVDFIIRNNFIMNFVKISEALDVPIKGLCLFTFALGCLEGGPFVIQCKAFSLGEAIAIWIKRISYQKYLSKEFRIKIRTGISKKYYINEICGMKNAYIIDWDGCDSILYVVKDSL